ncbi:hypothetical protein [Neoaquamicrobium sediminum]|uniref:hypothetical protein n=1 Tax=Neoaquamicrobium sediminum TaxID=1849104 RepID=UPI0015644464|nr:hypothetical protein [Mesorhizobium sediminum]NRC56991.1 hypothetical protein [Mesorhizobium sediminum]
MPVNQQIRQVPGLYRKRVGDIVITAVNDGIVPLPPEVMVGMAPDGVRKTLTGRFVPPSRM